MTLGYVDTSCLVAIAFGEPGAPLVARRLRTCDRLFASNVLEAELRSALARERVTSKVEPMLSGITWLHPNRPLTAEFRRVLDAGYLRGADLWHVACALFLAPGGRGLRFLTLDRRQREVTAKLGFR